jgi:hypothetical protein
LCLEHEGVENITGYLMDEIKKRNLLEKGSTVVLLVNDEDNNHALTIEKL